MMVPSSMAPLGPCFLEVVGFLTVTGDSVQARDRVQVHSHPWALTMAASRRASLGLAFGGGGIFDGTGDSVLATATAFRRRRPVWSGCSVRHLQMANRRMVRVALTFGGRGPETRRLSGGGRNRVHVHSRSRALLKVMSWAVP
ncbi:uncharacterized protein A4U43_C08F3700 [Asparagus officinalis]|nr:uncharacterized protein A4U43_C08F3700 [Asparagus officinalis]